MKETAAEEEEEEREWRSDAVEKITEEEEKQKSLRRNFESPAYTHFSFPPPSRLVPYSYAPPPFCCGSTSVCVSAEAAMWLGEGGRGHIF